MLQDLESAVSADEGQDGSQGFQHQSSWGQSWESASLRSLPHSHLLSASPMGWTLSDIVRTGQCPGAQTRVERESGEEEPGRRGKKQLDQGVTSGHGWRLGCEVTTRRF
ncbi:uncharacterized protein LOC129631575 isoform X16 [Bubalus kerabau]|uniref:uncharacterized protein LOC129631575 isoform X16 n=1 Tax=Bubalus carabanensis TaxID=3119969 RepID=UPI00244E7E8C|nr:uncharacterized protein LOC129631575 isoform X16 [Bubalus carabanensis]